MALHITTSKGFTKTWHVGQDLSYLFNRGNDFNINKVTEIQADGDELVKIRTLFNASSAGANYTIPIARVSVMNWFGDTARTILAALM